MKINKLILKALVIVIISNIGLQAEEKSSDSMKLFKELAKEYTSIEKTKLKNKSKKIDLVNKEKKTELTIKKNNFDVKRTDSMFNIEKRQPIALGYYKVGKNKKAMIDFRGKKFNLSIGNTIAGYRVRSISGKGVGFRTPYEENIVVPYMTSEKKRK